MFKSFFRKRNNTLTAIIFLLPSAVVFIVFVFYPILKAFRLSLFEWNNPSKEPIFIGLENYKELLSDARFMNSLKVTFTYAFSVTFISIILGLLIATILNNKNLPFKTFFRGLFFLPTVTPTIVAAMVWIILFNPTYGFINTILRNFISSPPNWFSDPDWALLTLMLLGIWRRLGFTIIIYLAALQNIPSEYYEIAQMDGANTLQTFRYVTIPQMLPTTLMLITLGLMDAFMVFDQVLITTRGGPAGVTEVVSLFLYTDAFTLFKMGKGSAISVIIFVIIMVITIIQWRLVGFGTNEDVA
ncbi:MAG TPA: ABC transporter permease [Anaerolineaceae bacterium]|nr:ABC transporter permease [Anaerolineaceae bacterium]